MNRQRSIQRYLRALGTLALVVIPCLAVRPAWAAERRVTIFYTGAIQGTLEPCGCTSDPLGGVERFAALVQKARKQGPTLILDGGNLSYPTGGLSPIKRQAADLRASFLARELGRVGLLASGLGVGDVVAGARGVRPPRLAVNLRAGSGVPIAGSLVREAGGLRLGVVGLVDPALAREQGWQAEDPVAAVRAEADRLRAAGAELVLVLAPLPRPLARKVARSAAVDVVILGGHDIGEGLAQAEKVDGAYLVSAGAELQWAGRLDIVVRDGAGGSGRIQLADADGPTARAERIARLEGACKARAQELAGWEKRREGADPAFVKRKRAELAEARAELARLQRTPWTAPAGSYFTNRLIAIRRALPQDAAILKAMRGLDRKIARVNLKNAARPPRGEPGRAVYVGDRSCAKCHREEMAHWKTTVHARGWKTLVDGGKQHDLECIGCHVTGYGEVGGTAVGFTRHLEAVQCETCHGPGSVHVKEEGLEEPVALRLQTPETACLQCHNEKHSDTFDYVAYLRDVLGPGHGEKARAALGDGPTGHQLRSAAMAKAKQAGEALKESL